MEIRILIPAQQEGMRTFCWRVSPPAGLCPWIGSAKFPKGFPECCKLEVREGLGDETVLLSCPIPLILRNISTFLPGNLIKISGPGCYMRINARACCKELFVAFSDLCGITWKPHRHHNPKIPDLWAGVFSWVHALSLKIKFLKK